MQLVNGGLDALLEAAAAMYDAANASVFWSGMKLLSLAPGKDPSWPRLPAERSLVFRQASNLCFPCFEPSRLNLRPHIQVSSLWVACSTSIQTVVGFNPRPSAELQLKYRQPQCELQRLLAQRCSRVAHDTTELESVQPDACRRNVCTVLLAQFEQIRWLKQSLYRLDGTWHAEHNQLHCLPRRLHALLLRHPGR